MSNVQGNQREIEVIVNGTNYGKFSFPDGTSIQGLVAQALAKTKNVGQPPANWVAKDPDGNVLDPNSHLSDHPNLTQIWLSLKAAEGGIVPADLG